MDMMCAAQTLLSPLFIQPGASMIQDDSPAELGNPAQRTPEARDCCMSGVRSGGRTGLGVGSYLVVCQSHVERLPTSVQLLCGGHAGLYALGDGVLCYLSTGRAISQGGGPSSHPAILQPPGRPLSPTGLMRLAASSLVGGPWHCPDWLSAEDLPIVEHECLQRPANVRSVIATVL